MIATTVAKPQGTVFYSWQSDLPNATNRGLIQEALERAAKTIRGDGSLAVDPVLDRDTQNVPGSPDIAHNLPKDRESIGVHCGCEHHQPRFRPTHA